MTPHEAVACGTVPVCFDMNGPWELIQQDYNGVVLPEIKPELMASELVNLYSRPGRLEFLRTNALSLFRTSQTLESRWRRCVNFSTCRKIHENALACRPPAGE